MRYDEFGLVREEEAQGEAELLLEIADEEPLNQFWFVGLVFKKMHFALVKFSVQWQQGF